MALTNMSNKPFTLDDILKNEKVIVKISMRSIFVWTASNLVVGHKSKILT